MGAQHARRFEDDEPVQESQDKPSAGPSTPQEYRDVISAALNNESLRGAQRAAAEGHARFPEDAELERLNRLLTFPPARSVPGDGRKRNSQKIYHWLDENEIHYRGQWIAVSEEGLLAAAPTLEELLRRIDEVDPENNSLIHHVH